MFSSRSLVFFCLLFTQILALNDQSSDTSPESIQERVNFQQSLNAIDATSLHAALHNFAPKKFHYGMLHEDKAVMEALHQDEPALASEIVRRAYLIKRVDNSTTPAPTAPVLTSTLVLMPGDAATPTSSIAQDGKSPDFVSPTTTSSSLPGSITMTAGQVMTTTDAQGHTIITTIGGGVLTLYPSYQTSFSTTPSPSDQGSSTSSFLSTSTAADGSQSIVTAVTIVPAGPAQTGSSTDRGGSSRTGSSQPGLQTGGAATWNHASGQFFYMLGAALGVAILA